MFAIMKLFLKTFVMLTASEITVAQDSKGSDQQADLPAAVALHKPLKVHLERIKARGNSAATFYVGKLMVGQPPRELKVLFDTSSGHVLVPHQACKSQACLSHKKYSPWKSSTAMDVNVDGSPVDKGRRFARNGLVRTGVSVDFTQADLGEGHAESVVVRDNVCMEGDAGDACVNLEIVTAVNMSDVPFVSMPNDGIVGLGLESLAAGHLLSFMAILMEESKNVLPQFGISFGPDGGDIYFGGQDPSLTAPIQWLPVDHPDGGYWQVDIKQVRVGGKVVDVCKRGCHGVVDSGTSHLGIQSYRLPMLRVALVTELLPTGCSGPSLEFDLGATVLTLEAPDYSDESCKPALGPLNLEEPAFVGVYAFGESVLRRYYAAFDLENKKVGFVPSTASAATVVV
jgi:cathepsin D